MSSRAGKGFDVAIDELKAGYPARRRCVMFVGDTPIEEVRRAALACLAALPKPTVTERMLRGAARLTFARELIDARQTMEHLFRMQVEQRALIAATTENPVVAAFELYVPPGYRLTAQAERRLEKLSDAPGAAARRRLMQHYRLHPVQVIEPVE